MVEALAKVRTDDEGLRLHIAFGDHCGFAAIAANYARDIAYQVNALTVMIIAAGLFGWKVRRTGEPEPEPETGYNDWGVRAGVVATTL